MRRLFLKIAILIVTLAVLSLLWIFLARHVSLLIDRIATVKINSRSIDRLSYEGTESGGTLKIDGLPLSTQGNHFKPFPLTFRADSQQRFVVVSDGKTFLLGPFSGDEGNFQIVPQARDQVSLTVRRSVLSWPTPFDMNFMTGHSPSWKRHTYYQFLWQKPSRQQLKMIWRYEQYFYPGDGWTSAMMTREGSTGLIRAEISP